MTAHETTLDKMRTRPRFKIYSNLKQDDYKDALQNYLDLNKDVFAGNINRETANIYVKTKDKPYWKPYLALRTENSDDNIVIRGIFGPSSEVWTFFMFIYFGLSILWMVFITLWFVGTQINTDDYDWALSVSFITLGLVLLMYIASKIGQQKAKNEMKLLRQFAIDSTLKHERNEDA